jgi:hypothetical protein
MEQTLYIIVYRSSEKDAWGERVQCTFEDERLADNMLEIKRSQDPFSQYAKVTGTLLVPGTVKAETPKIPLKSFEHPTDHAHIQE